MVAGILAAVGVQAAGNNWDEYLGGKDRDHYSTLTQITPANVARLQPAWTYHSGDLAQIQCNPLIIDGVLYAETGKNRVFALDAATGAQQWIFADPTEAAEANNNRGVSYWAAGDDRRIFATIGSWLYALDARTGKRLPQFGENGRVSLRTGLGASSQPKWVVSTTPGTVVGDLIVMPTRVSEDSDAARGDIQAFDVRTGKLVWVFHTIPFPGEPGYETWPPDAYKNVDVGSANNWAGMSVDVERGILFVPTGSASPDFWGGHRIGSDLYANSLVALDARTGRRLWHYQFVHHDIWDRDLPAPPNLVTIHRGGREIPAVAQVTKAGYVFVFNRLTGEPIFPMIERPYPPSHLDGEKTWPTQPLPSAPPPFTRQHLEETDINPWAHNHDALVAEFRAAQKGDFQPFSTQETIIFPGFDGGAEWGGAGATPDGILYVNANEVPWVASLTAVTAETAHSDAPIGERLYAQYCAACHAPDRSGHPASGYPDLRAAASRLHEADIVALIGSGRRMMPGFTAIPPDDRVAIARFVLGEKPAAASADAAPVTNSAPLAPPTPYRFNGYTKMFDDQGYPAIRPPWGTLTAIDLNSGTIRWHVPLGELKELKDRGIPQTGVESYGGPVLTASGLLFIAATRDGMVRAFDRNDGKLLWEAPLPAPAFATASTYMVGGKQYVVVGCGGDKLGLPPADAFVAFALP